MKPREIPRTISLCHSIRKSVILLGPPGVGKTAQVLAFAESLARRLNVPLVDANEFVTLREFEQRCPGGGCVLFVYINANTMLPVDLAGIPDKHSADGSVYTVYTPNAVWLACRRAKACVVFVDEFNTTDNPDMVAAIMRLIGEKRAGSVHLRDAVIVAAGNPPEVNATAKPVPAPMMGGKACVFYVEPPTVQEWIQYMHSRHGDRWDTTVAGFLAENPGFFIARRIDAEMPYPTPRGWEAVALLGEKTEELVASLVGREAARAFLAYRKAAPPSLAEIARENSIELKYVKLIGYAARGALCRSLEHNEEAELLQRLLEELVEKVGPDTAAIVSYVGAPHCPARFARYWRLVPEKAKTEALAGRLVLAEATEAAGSEEEVLEELL